MLKDEPFKLKLEYKTEESDTYRVVIIYNDDIEFASQWMAEQDALLLFDVMLEYFG